MVNPIFLCVPSQNGLLADPPQRQSQDRRMPMAKLAESIVQADELLELPHHQP